jgi:hypothetical protein
LESRPRSLMADSAALLEDTLPQFLDVAERFLCVGLLRARGERENAEENQNSPSDASHRGILLGKLYHEGHLME